MPDPRDVLQQLEALGSEQTRKTWRRHGVPEPMFGVKYGDLEKLRKRLGRDHALACALWQSGNHDARVLAAMIADPAAFDAATLRAWQAGVTCGAQNGALTTHVAAHSPAAREVVAGWLDAASESPRQAGWMLVSQLAKDDPDLEDSFFAPLVARIEKEIHAAPNRAREAMNWALIGIGARSDRLQKLALAAARAIGPVAIDHGDTDCKTPDATAYIPKAREHRAKQEAKKPAAAAKKAAAARAAAVKKTPAREPAAAAKKPAAAAKKPAARKSAVRA